MYRWYLVRDELDLGVFLDMLDGFAFELSTWDAHLAYEIV
jgi:hypothetical protein